MNGLVLLLSSILLTSCDDSKAVVTPKPDGTQNIIYQLGMKGYATNSSAVGRFGIANTEAEARQGRGVLLTGQVNWAETKGGKEAKSYELINQAVGSRKWIFLTSSSKPTGTQAVTLNYLISKSLTLNVSSGDTLVVQEYVVE